MAQMANQDPESIMFNWSGPFSGEEEAARTRRTKKKCSSWTAPTLDISGPCFFCVCVFSSADPWTFQKEAPWWLREGKDNDQRLLLRDCSCSRLERHIGTHSFLHLRRDACSLPFPSELYRRHSLHSPRASPTSRIPLFVAWQGSEVTMKRRNNDAMRDYETSQAPLSNLIPHNKTCPSSMGRFHKGVPDQSLVLDQDWL